MIVWNNIKNLFIHHRLMAFLFLLVLFVTDISVFYALNFYHQITDMQAFYDDEARSYSMAYEGEELAERLDGFCADFSRPLKRIYVQLQYHSDRILANYLGESSARIKVFFGHYFHESSTDEILAPRTGKYQIGDDYFLEGKPFKIIGINAEDVFEIPFASIPAHTPLTVTFVTENPLTQKELQQLQACVSASFGVSTLKLPDKQSSNQNILIECIVLLGILLLTLLNVAYLYSSLAGQAEKAMPDFPCAGLRPGEMRPPLSRGIVDTVDPAVWPCRAHLRGGHSENHERDKRFLCARPDCRNIRRHLCADADARHPVESVESQRNFESIGDCRICI